jgi:hypothetical protein
MALNGGLDVLMDNMYDWKAILEGGGEDSEVNSMNAYVKHDETFH